jgi:hypothetical protein
MKLLCLTVLTLDGRNSNAHARNDWASLFHPLYKLKQKKHNWLLSSKWCYHQINISKQYSDNFYTIFVYYRIWLAKLLAMNLMQ